MTKTLTGIVTSDKSEKTITVTISSPKTHPIYKKQYSFSRKFLAHDESSSAKVGDKVIIGETRPLSARKRFTLLQVVERAGIKHEEPKEEDKT